jgi:hypothetical protein
MNTIFKKILFILLAIVVLPAMSQTYPDKPIKVIIGFAAGGPTDVIARVLAQDMTATLGQSVIVENKSGANAKIATEYVAQAPADGYTLLFASLSHNVNAIMFKKPGYDDEDRIKLLSNLKQFKNKPIEYVRNYYNNNIKERIDNNRFRSEYSRRAANRRQNTYRDFYGAKSLTDQLSEIYKLFKEKSRD